MHLLSLASFNLTRVNEIQPTAIQGPRFLPPRVKMESSKGLQGLQGHTLQGHFAPHRLNDKPVFGRIEGKDPGISKNGISTIRCRSILGNWPSLSFMPTHPDPHQERNLSSC
jgi:hypothetical protein